MRKRIRLISLVSLAALPAAGCFLQLTIAVREATTLSEEIDLVIDAIRTQATVAVCQTDPFFSPGFRRCTYVIDGEPVTSTTTLLSEGGIAGAVLDPVILELPAGVTNITGTFAGGGLSGNLIVYPSLSFVPIDDTRTLTPGPGKQLAIVDLPANAPVDGVTYDYELRFSQLLPRGGAPTEVKALLAARVRVGPKTFYPPLLPCVTSFAAAPSIQLASSSAPQGIAFPGNVAPCNNAPFAFFRAHRGCDLDNDLDVDTGDINLIMAVRNQTAAAGDPRDVNADALINANDARVCTLQCTRARCAS
jgi:hypothetical protein